jgi:uncharacterized protein
MRSIFLTAAVLYGFAARCQNGRDCATAATASDKTVCSSSQLKALDREFEAKFEQTIDDAILFGPEDLYRQRQRWDRDVAQCAGPNAESCLRRAYDRRFTYLKYLRMSAALDPRLPDPGAPLHTAQTRGWPGKNLYELLTMDPVLAPVAASQLGIGWNSWAEAGAQPESRLRALPGGRWLIGRGSIKTKDSQKDLYIAIDLRDAQLSVIYYQDYSGELYEPFLDLEWTTTAGSWPSDATKVLQPLGGRAWQPENARTVGLPSTRVQPWPREKPDCTGVEGAVAQAICRSEEIRFGFEKEARLWEDLSVLGLIGDPEYRQFRVMWNKDKEECAKEHPVETCLLRRLEERSVLTSSERIAQGLDRLPANARQELAKLSASALLGLRTQDLLAVQRVVAPLAASVIGPAWLSWAESAVSGDGVEVVPGGRWLIARGWMTHNVMRREIWVAIDQVDCQLWLVRLEQYTSDAEPEIRWASTAPGWPATVAKLLAQSGPGWDRAWLRQVGLPGTRTHPGK